MGVWLSGSAHCGKEKYPTMKLAGPVSGFEYKNTLYDPKTDIQGFVCILPSDKTIHVVLRGSSSTMNWSNDFEVRQVKEKNNEENFDYMKTNKDNLKNIIKDNSIIPIINELVERTNKIVIHINFLNYI